MRDLLCWYKKDTILGLMHNFEFVTRTHISQGSLVSRQYVCRSTVISENCNPGFKRIEVVFCCLMIDDMGVEAQNRAVGTLKHYLNEGMFERILVRREASLKVAKQLVVV